MDNEYLMLRNEMLNSTQKRVVKTGDSIFSD